MLTYIMALVGVMGALSVMPWLDDRALRKARQAKREATILQRKGVRNVLAR